MRDERSSYEKTHDLGERFVRPQLGLDSGHFSYLLRPAEARLHLPQAQLQVLHLPVPVVGDTE